VLTTLLITLGIGAVIGLLVGVPLGRAIERVRPAEDKKRKVRKRR
jgi:ABC-type nitrate/sulfonate/bicarbonate transport system permease component